MACAMARHHRIDPGRVATPAGMPAPPPRSINMSRPVGYTPPAEGADTELARRFPLALISPAGRNSTFASLSWHRDRTGPPRVHLHPDDVAARGLADGDAARVHNDRGEFLATVAVDDATRPGLAFTYKAYWARLSPGGSTVNAVTGVRDTDLGGGPTFHDTRVQVEAAPAGQLP
ncbi:molybdopterin dinucleotide binding domain-containing protein [Micromonospora psammae]|uniref:molybdopterin dinucleotide binding domain-containing protein n=1 Tax=Micromonospora sp. CPCC 205556 TaxID=3122398 RepID=UPI002FF403DC